MTLHANGLSFSPMCVNIKEVRNRYTNQIVYAKCGKCEACLQEKANFRANKIRYHERVGYDALFVHLTYADAYVPYIYISDLESCHDELHLVPVYRKHNVRWYYHRPCKDHCCYSTLDCEEQISYHFYKDLKNSDIFKLFDIGGGRCAVLYYKDVQNFFKRLRHNLERNEKFNKLVSSGERISYFATGEYGETNQRCHFHILLYVPSCNEQALELWKDVICRSWLFAFDFVTRNAIERAINASSYCAEYVNSSANVSPFLKSGRIRPTWHYSHGFGLAVPAFDLDNIVNLIFNKKPIEFNTLHAVAPKTYIPVAVSIPRYVLDRYFPRFKSLCRLSYETIYQIVSRPDSIFFLDIYGLSREDKVKIFKLLSHCYEKYYLPRSFSHYDFAYLFIEFLKLKNKMMFMTQYGVCRTKEEQLQWYYNTKDYFERSDISRFNDMFGYLDLSFDDYDFIVDVNSFSSNIRDTCSLKTKYFNRVKQKRINQLCPRF